LPLDLGQIDVQHSFAGMSLHTAPCLARRHRRPDPNGHHRRSGNRRRFPLPSSPSWLHCNASAGANNSSKVPTNDDQGHAFADSNQVTSPTLEQKIVRELWRWSTASEPERVEILSSRSDLAGAIEFYLCHAFGLKNSAPSSKWWCDGVLELTVSHLNPTNFQIVGLVIWAFASPNPHFFIAPFEIDLNFTISEAAEANRIVVRFGATENTGGIQCVPYSDLAVRLVESRPKRDQDWAFAIELT
jgi:hypothetical protein